MSFDALTRISQEERCPTQINGVTVFPWKHGNQGFLPDHNSEFVGQQMQEQGIRLTAVDGLLSQSFYGLQLSPDSPPDFGHYNIIVEGSDLNSSFGSLLTHTDGIDCIASDVYPYWDPSFKAKKTDLSIALGIGGGTLATIWGISKLINEKRTKQNTLPRRDFNKLLVRAFIGSSALLAAEGLFIGHKRLRQIAIKEEEFQRVAACNYMDPPIEGGFQLVSFRNGLTMSKLLHVINAQGISPEHAGILFGYTHLDVDHDSYRMPAAEQQTIIAKVYNQEMERGHKEFIDNGDQQALFELLSKLSGFLISASTAVTTRVHRDESRITIAAQNHYFLPSLLAGTGFVYDDTNEDPIDPTSGINSNFRVAQIVSHVLKTFTAQLKQ